MRGRGRSPGNFGSAAVALIDYLIAGAGGVGLEIAGNGGTVIQASGVALPLGAYSVVRGAGSTGSGQGAASSFNGVSAPGGIDDGSADNPGIGGVLSSISGASLLYGRNGSYNFNGTGGAARGYGGDSSGGPGGNGIVVIRYLTGTMTATGGTVTTSGGYTIHTFTANGTFTRTA